MSMLKISLFIVSLTLLISNNLNAEPLIFESEGQHTRLIELYTSEGCSSCPPAERYLNKYKYHPELWKTYFPVAFHVDYWDYLGWKDRFSKADYSKRQRLYARVNQQRTVYTPAFMVNGQNWRPGFYNKGFDIENSNAGRLKVLIEKDELNAEYSTNQEHARLLQLNIAVLGMDIHSTITAGENEGNKAKHEFVVLDHRKVSSRSNKWKLQLPKIDTKDTMQFALVVWVSRPGHPKPIQVVGGPLPNTY